MKKTVKLKLVAVGDSRLDACGHTIIRYGPDGKVIAHMLNGVNQLPQP